MKKRYDSIEGEDQNCSRRLQLIETDRSRFRLLGILVVVIFLGLASRKFGNMLPGFVADNAGDALWTVAVFVSLAIVFPRWPAVRIGLLAFAISVIVEISQLSDASLLVAIRSNRFGRLFLGQGFVWADFLRYFVGAFVATGVDVLFWPRRREATPSD